MANAATRSAAASGGATSYDSVAQALHWLVAALAVGVVLLGWTIEGTPRNTPQRDLLMMVHSSVGLSILGAMAFRAGWRWRHPPPPLPSSLGRLEAALARCTHLVLYLIFILMPLAGYLNAAAAGHAVSFFGIVTIPPVFPENGRLSQVAIAIHLVGQYPLYLFVGFHIAGALFHGAIRRDGIVERMLPLRRLS
jgi:cytochrome b561